MEKLSLQLNDGVMTVFVLNVTKQADIPTIIMVHDAHGLTPDALEQAKWLSQHGYRVVAPDVFYRVGELQTTSILGNTIEAMMSLRKGMTNQGHKSDMEILSRHIKNTYHSNRKIGITGFCLGGRITYLAASNTSDFDAAVAFYPTRLREADPAIRASLKPIDNGKNINIPLMIFFPELDEFNPPDGIEVIHKASITNKHPLEIITVKGANHGFAQSGSPGFHPQSSKEAWGRALDFFSTHLF